MRPMVEFMTPKEKRSKKPRRFYISSPFNTILYILLLIVFVYFMVKGFIWAWNTLGAWETI